MMMLAVLSINYQSLCTLSTSFDYALDIRNQSMEVEH